VKSKMAVRKWQDPADHSTPSRSVGGVTGRASKVAGTPDEQSVKVRRVVDPVILAYEVARTGLQVLSVVNGNTS